MGLRRLARLPAKRSEMWPIADDFRLNSNTAMALWESATARAQRRCRLFCVDGGAWNVRVEHAITYRETIYHYLDVGDLLDAKIALAIVLCRNEANMYPVFM